MSTSKQVPTDLIKSVPLKGSLLVVAKNGLASTTSETFKGDYETSEVGERYFFGRNLYNHKFADHKIVAHEGNLLLAADGVMLNDAQLKAKYAANSIAEIYSQAWQTNGKNLLDEIEGEISLIVFNKETLACHAFCSRVGTKALFYFANQEYFVLSSNLFALAKALRLLQIPYTLNEFAAYCFLTYGHLFTNLTLIQEVTRVEPGMLVDYQNSAATTQPYRTLTNYPQLEDSEEGFLQEVNQRFNHAVEGNYNKDREYGYKHIAQLSGGLDSRMNLITAYDLGYKKQTVVSFGVEDCWDSHIAKDVTRKLGMDFKFVALDIEKYYDNVWEPLLYTNCQIYYSAALHTLHANKQIDFSAYGFLHTGQVGDAVVATSLFNLEQHENPDINAVRRFSNRFYPKLEGQLQSMLQAYGTKDVSTYNVIVNNFTISGNWIINNFTEMISPFQHKDVFFYTRRIPQKYKVNYRLYFEWMKRFHPLSVTFRHQKTMRRTLPATPRLANSIRYRWDTFYIKYLAKHLKYDMLPDEEKLMQNQPLQTTYQAIIDRYTPTLPNEQLQHDLKLHFKEGNLKERMFCVSLAAIYCLLFDPLKELDGNKG